MSPRAAAALRLMFVSGSWIHSTSSGTAPAATTEEASDSEWRAMHPGEARVARTQKRESKTQSEPL